MNLSDNNDKTSSSAVRSAPISGWPDGPTPGSSRIPTTISNLEHMLEHEGISVRYNMIKKDIVITIPAQSGTTDNSANVQMARIKSLAAKHGLSTAHVDDFIQAIADQNAFNPAADWINSRPWDNQDRLEHFLATVTTAQDYPSDLKRTILTKWLLSAVSAALKPSEFKARGVLVLQGPQGIGKTTWIGRLISNRQLRSEFVRLDHHMDWSNKDSLLGAVNNWIVELGELEGTLRRELPQLKSFVTADVDKVRRPYERKESVYPRRTVFAATVNDIAFLIDDTGNTRWWTVAVTSLDYQHEIDMQQLFAQLAERLEEGDSWWLTMDEEAMLESWNARHRSVSAIAELVLAAIEGNPALRQQPEWVTASGMLRLLGIKQPSNSEAKQCAVVLRQVYGESRRRNGQQMWPVVLVGSGSSAWSPGKKDVKNPSVPQQLVDGLPYDQKDEVF